LYWISSNSWFVNTTRLAGRDVAPDLEGGLVGHGDLALADVLQQVVESGLQALAAGFEQGLLRLRVEGEEVRRRGGIDPLGHGKLDPLARLAVALDAFRQAGHELRVQQICACIERGERILLPGGIRETRVGYRRCRAFGMREEVVPQPGQALHVVLLHF
jgi:hypothetical protein